MAIGFNVRIFCHSLTEYSLLAIIGSSSRSFIILYHAYLFSGDANGANGVECKIAIKSYSKMHAGISLNNASRRLIITCINHLIISRNNRLRRPL